MSEVSMAAVARGFSQPVSGKTPSPVRICDAAQQFEALLIGQILESATPTEGWMGTNDEAGNCATSFAREQLAGAMAKAGGFGLGRLIAKGLENSDGSAPDRPAFAGSAVTDSSRGPHS